MKWVLLIALSVSFIAPVPAAHTSHQLEVTHTPPAGPAIQGDDLTVVAKVSTSCLAGCSDVVASAVYVDSLGMEKSIDKTLPLAAFEMSMSPNLSQPQTVNLRIPGEDVRYPAFSYRIRVTQDSHNPLNPHTAVATSPESGDHSVPAIPVLRATFKYPDGSPFANQEINILPGVSGDFWTVSTDSNGRFTFPVPLADEWISQRAFSEQYAILTLELFDNRPAEDLPSQPYTPTGWGALLKVIVNLGDSVLDAVDTGLQDQEIVVSERDGFFVTTGSSWIIPDHCELTGPLGTGMICKHFKGESSPRPIVWSQNFGGGMQFRTSQKYCQTTSTISSTLHRLGTALAWEVGSSTTTEYPNTACMTVPIIGPNDNKKINIMTAYAWYEVWTCRPTLANPDFWGCQIHEEFNPYQWMGELIPVSNVPFHDDYRASRNDCIAQLLGPPEAGTMRGTRQEFDMTWGPAGVTGVRITAYTKWYTSKNSTQETQIRWNFDGDHEIDHFERPPYHYLYVVKGKEETPPKCWPQGPGRARTYVSDDLVVSDV